MSGLFGIVSKGDCARELFYGVDYHSHLGTEFGGMAVLGEKFNRQIHNISQTQFKSKFYDDYHHMKGNAGIGVISDCDEQPMYLNSKFGPFCIVTTGLVENKKELQEILFKKGASFSEISHGLVNVTELIAKLISLGDNLIDGIEKVFDMIEGSCSLLVLSKEGVYAVRDRYGYTSLVIGKKDNDWAVASESCALPNLGFSIEKFLAPGEVVLLSNKELQIVRQGNSTEQICSFLWIYTGFPASNYDGINVEIVRERSGAALARRDKDLDFDMVAGIPDSGVAHAIGYAMESGKPYRRPFVKYTPGYGRSYTPPDQERRDLIATMKLVPITDIIKGNKIVICEDSIVRGTQLKNLAVKKLWNAGAKEIHVRAACPPLMFPCKYCLSTRTTKELAGRRAIKALEGKELQDISCYLDPSTQKYRDMVEWVRKDLEVTTLKYQTIEDMVQAIGLPRERLCLQCWTGECPAKECPAKACHS